MTGEAHSVPAFSQPDYDYGNHPQIEIIRLTPFGGEGIDPHDSLDHDTNAEPLFTEAQLAGKIAEIADNYMVIGDPQSTEANPKHFGVTIANQDRMAEGVPAILVMSTSGSSLYDEKHNPNNQGNALELAFTAFSYPDRPIVYIESPGNGNSVDLEVEEYAEAVLDGKLVRETRDTGGRIVDYEAFETMQSMARALDAAGIRVSHVSANTSGAHFSTALLAALPEGSVERAFLYNPTNISDRSALGLGYNWLKEIVTQRRYAGRSKDPLRLTAERMDMAKKVMSSRPKRKIDQARASTHNPAKLKRQNDIFKRGNRNGASAAVQSVAGQLRHPDLRQTFVLPQFAAMYKDPEDFHVFMRRIAELGGRAVEISDLESLQIPMGQYGHSHYPTVRHTLEGYAFNR